MRNLRIGEQNYKIFINDSTRITGTLGNCDADYNAIHLSSEYPKSKIESTLAHEIAHALLKESGAYTFLKDLEENFVQILEPMFYSFLKHNTNFYERFDC